MGAIGLQIDLPLFHHPNQDDYVRYFQETFQEFLRQMEPHFTEKDRLALLIHERLTGTRS